MPFGRRRARGIVVALEDEPPGGDRAARGREGRRAGAAGARRAGAVARRLLRLDARRARSRSSRPSCRSGARSRRRRRSGSRCRARREPAELLPGAAGRGRADRRRGGRRRRAARSCSTGPTGSGKTEVYLQACAAALERGLGAIILVPEISLAPQTVGRVRARFGDRVAILHSGLTEAERRDERERIASGEARIVVGARSAVFAPVRGLGADRRRRGARRLLQAGLRPALRRAHAGGEARRARGGGRRLRLRDAAARELGGARAARARRPGRAASCRRCRSSTSGARRATRCRRRSSPSCDGWPSGGGKAILLLNRRGIAPALHCRACGRTIRCPNCDVALVLHRDGGAPLPPLRPRASRRPTACPSCGSAEVARLGAGTQWLERELAKEFPELDADPARRRHRRRARS